MGWGCPSSGGRARSCLLSSLDTVVLVSKLLVIEAKLVHEGGGHLLQLVLREGLRARQAAHSAQTPGRPRVGCLKPGPLHVGLPLRQVPELVSALQGPEGQARGAAHAPAAETAR